MSPAFKVLGFVAAACASQTLSAAEFYVSVYDEPYDDGPGAYIVMEGETEIGDYTRFLEVLPEAIGRHGSVAYPIDVWLEGPGGDLEEALRIGQLIFDLGFATLVGDDEQCASACALIWLGGFELFMERRAMIGFHQAYVGEGEASISGNAIVGHYLSQVGLDPAVVQYVVSSKPNEMSWLTPEVARAISLDVSVLGE